MKEFPKWLAPKYEDNFTHNARVRNKCYMRRDIVELLIQRAEETEYFDLNEFNSKHINNIEITKEIAKELVQELHDLNWKTTFCYGGTGLFIYKNDPPRNCFPDGELY